MQPLGREAEDFRKGGKCPKDMPLPAYLDYLQPKAIT